jgi:hypothetical protein
MDTQRTHHRPTARGAAGRTLRQLIARSAARLGHDAFFGVGDVALT